jgi:hypothetical protein
MTTNSSIYTIVCLYGGTMHTPDYCRTVVRHSSLVFCPHTVSHGLQHVYTWSTTSLSEISHIPSQELRHLCIVFRNCVLYSGTVYVYPGIFYVYLGIVYCINSTLLACELPTLDSVPNRLGNRGERWRTASIVDA